VVVVPFIGAWAMPRDLEQWFTPADLSSYRAVAWWYCAFAVPCLALTVLLIRARFGRNAVAVATCSGATAATAVAVASLFADQERPGWLTPAIVGSTVVVVAVIQIHQHWPRPSERRQLAGFTPAITFIGSVAGSTWALYDSLRTPKLPASIQLGFCALLTVLLHIGLVIGSIAVARSNQRESVRLAHADHRNPQRRRAALRRVTMRFSQPADCFTLAAVALPILFTPLFLTTTPVQAFDLRHILRLYAIVAAAVGIVFALGARRDQ
jgi:hypothetical protein